MDFLLLLPGRWSNSDLRSQGRKLPQIPSGTGEEGEHTYSEVGGRSSTTRTDDALYAMVGRAGQTDTPAPPAVPANTPAPPDPDGDVEGGLPENESQVMTPPHPPEAAEYACVRKLRKADKAPQKRDSGTDMAEPPVPPPRHPPPSHPAPPPPHPHSTKLPAQKRGGLQRPIIPKATASFGGSSEAEPERRGSDPWRLFGIGVTSSSLNNRAEKFLGSRGSERCLFVGEPLVIARCFSSRETITSSACSQQQGAEAGCLSLLWLQGSELPSSEVAPAAVTRLRQHARFTGLHVKRRLLATGLLEVMFMGNGEQYIWKPPEDEELLLLQNKALGQLGAQTLENIQPSAAAVAEMYSKVCKTGKKKRAVPGSPPANPGFRTLGRGDRDGGFSVVVKPQTWAPLEGKAIGGPLDDHCYESIGTEEFEPSYENIEGGGAWKRERPPNTCATLRPRRKKAQQPLQQQQPPPPPPTQQNPKLQHLPAKALLLPGENLYESIGDLKQGSANSSTTTIFTFNDGMEMYVTGL
ncbi:unnamed protein product [Pleuronectes platessa]|uniref:Uncharacterized protein n=1 Tax=Pleuronectes platessa TaxID=8262 RepID=A0A9N7VVR3_PLEPL|nr:unnamed protein product [Pleuronectes platessa]